MVEPVERVLGPLTPSKSNVQVLRSTDNHSKLNFDALETENLAPETPSLHRTSNTSDQNEMSTFNASKTCPPKQKRAISDTFSYKVSSCERKSIGNGIRTTDPMYMKSFTINPVRTKHIRPDVPEDIRECAQNLRLRLQLAMYKVQVNQPYSPLRELPIVSRMKLPTVSKTESVTTFWEQKTPVSTTKRPLHMSTPTVSRILQESPSKPPQRVGEQLLTPKGSDTTCSKPTLSSLQNRMLPTDSSPASAYRSQSRRYGIRSSAALMQSASPSTRRLRKSMSLSMVGQKRTSSKADCCSTQGTPTKCYSFSTPLKKSKSVIEERAPNSANSRETRNADKEKPSSSLSAAAHCLTQLGMMR
ncbi:negative regulator-MBF [Schizosaccharomyces japonicus yFS275]|uniref:Negative regulator-MBF n=1 Tax=Schizosaccharomyces japonicus (strain yFS275 / FY16936) TaxID=402676 RepID=B6K6P4_SCHJY|nr:negative regulator-MBF [Schizosaccharomyces japonicus yFS275]EEB09198.1 negative regulator-MBF [Schizosaccharomyces japonicus yFS275]